MQEKIQEVVMGQTRKKCHFLSLSLVNPLTNEEIREFCQKLFDEGITLEKEFLGKEIFIYPSILVEDYFLIMKLAVEQYQNVLQILGFDRWANHIAIKSDIFFPLEPGKVHSSRRK